MIHQLSRSANQPAPLINENSGKILRLHFYHESFALLHKSTKNGTDYTLRRSVSADFHQPSFKQRNSVQLIWKSTPTPTAEGRDNIGLQSL